MTHFLIILALLWHDEKCSSFEQNYTLKFNAINDLWPNIYWKSYFKQLNISHKKANVKGNTGLGKVGKISYFIFVVECTLLAWF